MDPTESPGFSAPLFHAVASFGRRYANLRAWLSSINFLSVICAFACVATARLHSASTVLGRRGTTVFCQRGGTSCLGQSRELLHRLFLLEYSPGRSTSSALPAAIRAARPCYLRTSGPGKRPDFCCFLSVRSLAGPFSDPAGGVAEHRYSCPFFPWLDPGDRCARA